MLCNFLTFGIHQSRKPACPHFPLPIPAQSLFVAQGVVSSPSHLLFSLSKNAVNSVPSGSVRSPSSTVQEYVLSTSWTPAPSSFISHMNLVLLSVDVPSSLS